MLAWDGLVLLAALLDGMRLPRAAMLIAARNWSNAPSLDSQTEIELTVENQGAVIIECFLTDDLPPALRDASDQLAPLRITAFPRVPAPIRYRVEPQERGDCTTGPLYIRYRSPLGLAERWAMRRWRRQCAFIPLCAPVKSSRFFSRAAGKSICSCARRASAGLAVTLKACAIIAKATTCATSAGLRARGGAT